MWESDDWGQFQVGKMLGSRRKTSVFSAHSVFSVKHCEWKSATTLVSPGIYAAESQIL